MGVRGAALIFTMAIFIAGIFLFAQQSNVINLNIPAAPVKEEEKKENSAPPVNGDIPAQPKLADPPEIIKAVYATSWSAASEKKLNYLINLIRETELNAIVVDIKDYTGYVIYNTDLELPKKYDAIELRIPRLNKLIKRLHDEKIYVIGRISVFQDQRLALARPDIALYSSSTGMTWKDRKGLMWMDSAAKEVWDYNIAIAKEILDRGFDEVNFDYIRFASDGDLSDIRHPVWDEKTLKTHVMRNFYEYIRERLPAGDYTVSADLFGLVTVNTDGLGIGQHLEFALPNFDAIAPMTYPSHYFKNFIGIENPAAKPYEVIKYSMDRGIQRYVARENALPKIERIINTTAPDGSATTTVTYEKQELPSKLRPWFQDFDLGADYDAEMVRAQIRAWEDSSAIAPKYFGGWMLWNPSNIYTKEALLPFYQPPAAVPES